MSIYKKAVDHFGAEHQGLKTVEELSELSAALTKYFLAQLAGNQPTNANNVAEELADAKIMLEQLKYVLPPEIMSKSGRIKGDKLNRLNKLIQKNNPILKTGLEAQK